MKFFLIFLFVVPAFADFNRTSGLVDIPKAEILPHLGYRLGVDGSIALDSEHSVDEFDYNLHTALGLADQLELYLDVYTFEDFTAAFGFCHRFLDKNNFALAWGVHQLSYDLDVSEVGHGDSVGWDDDLDYSTYDGYQKPFELGSAFLVSTFSPSKFLEFTLGLGRGRYVGYGPQSKYFNSEFYHDQGGDWGVGLILGFDLKLAKGLSILADLDGRDANVGLNVQYQPIEFSLALTKLEHFRWEGFSPRFSAALSYFKYERGKPKPAAIAGTVTDKEDGRPLAAEVGFLHARIPKKITAAEKGTFRFGDLKSGIYEIYGRADGYIGVKKRVKLAAGKTLYTDFELRKKKVAPKTGDIIGKVFDLKTKQPLVAKLTLVEANKTTNSDATGIFEFTDLIAPNAYKIKAEAEGYESGFYPTAVNAGEKTKANIGMVKRGMVITLKGIKFDFNRSTIKPESYPILDQAAAILTSHPNIKVELQGHTDSVGSNAYNLRLSNARANSVRTYLINTHNIDPARLVARGYGETQPIADNRTAGGRAQNRRVDFVILKK